MTAFRELHEYGESTIDDTSLLACMMPDGGLDIMKFQFKEKAAMFELSLLNEAGVIDNDTSPTRKVIDRTAVKQIISGRSRSLLLHILDGDFWHPATPKDSLWYHMYVAQPMINLPQFHSSFWNCFRMPYAHYIQFVNDAYWFPHLMRWKSTFPMKLLTWKRTRWLVSRCSAIISMSLLPLVPLFFTPFMLFPLQ
jgi:hypothetical protein